MAIKTPVEAMDCNTHDWVDPHSVHTKCSMCWKTWAEIAERPRRCEGAFGACSGCGEVDELFLFGGERVCADCIPVPSVGERGAW